MFQFQVLPVGSYDRRNASSLTHETGHRRVQGSSLPKVAGISGVIYGPMGRAVIGGLAPGTLPTLLVVPCPDLITGRFKRAPEIIK